MIWKPELSDELIQCLYFEVCLFLQFCHVCLFIKILFLLLFFTGNIFQSIDLTLNAWFKECNLVFSKIQFHWSNFNKNQINEIIEITLYLSFWMPNIVQISVFSNIRHTFASVQKITYNYFNKKFRLNYCLRLKSLIIY